jgi:tetratricopeptide (TPR) repeat protein
MLLSGLMGSIARLARGWHLPPGGAEAERLLRAATAAAARGDSGVASGICEDILARYPRHAASHHLLGVIVGRDGDLPRARAHIAQAVALAPDWPDAHLAHGNVQQLLGDVSGAETSYRRVLELSPGAASGHYNLAVLLDRAGRKAEALYSLGRAHELDPGRADVTWDLVQRLLEAGDFESAFSAAERTLACGGSSAAAHKALGLVHLWRHEPQSALEHFEGAVALAPADAEAWLHAGIAEQELARLDNALASYERALRLKPDYPQAQWRRSLIRLLKGEFDRAWPDYEVRLVSEERPQRRFPQSRWRGEPLAGKTLLVHAEQGLGDEIMFASCLPDVVAQAGHCVIDCHPGLAPIFRRSFPAATVHGGHQTDDSSWLAECPAPDYQVPIGSLPLLLRRGLGDFPRHAGYLRADPLKVMAWRRRLGGLGPGLNVGLSWQGGTRLSRAQVRSLTLEQLAPVLRLAGVKFIDLQYTDTVRERAALEERYGVKITHWQEAIADYDETAALVAALDLTLSVCTAVVHLAGALGREAWVMTPFSPEWRYGQAGEGMIWYPSVKLVRQPRYGEWEPVIVAIGRQLAQRASGDAGREIPENRTGSESHGS